METKQKCKNKVIVFSEFAQMCKILFIELSEWNPLIIIGETPTEVRHENVEKFNYDPKYKILIMSNAGTYGLNLQAASFIINYDLPYSVAKLEQRIGRAHRVGQTEPVTVYNLICRGTIDEYVSRVLHAKQKTSVKLLKDFERLEEKGMSADDIKRILRI